MVEISELNDDLIGHILKRVSDPGGRKRFSQVCKQWLKVEGLTRTSLNLLRLSFLRQKLNLSRLRNVSDRSMVFVAENCPNLKFLDLSGTRVTGAGIRAFSGHMCLESFVLRSCYAFSWRDVKHMVLGCPVIEVFRPD
ncbi:hypothetical protein ACLB2K_017555 [Fragaria x ananassa]